MPEQRIILGILTEKFAYFEVGASLAPRNPGSPANWPEGSPQIETIGLSQWDGENKPAWAQIHLSDGKVIHVWDIHDITFSASNDLEGWIDRDPAEEEEK
tara:strand:+ start:54 stop:353 length:300 start_codon:yes stop_codon:yes gene_type:complete